MFTFFFFVFFYWLYLQFSLLFSCIYSFLYMAETHYIHQITTVVYSMHVCTRDFQLNYYVFCISFCWLQIESIYYVSSFWYTFLMYILPQQSFVSLWEIFLIWCNYRAAADALSKRHVDGSLPLESFNIELEDQSGQKVQLGSENDQRYGLETSYFYNLFYSVC